MNQREGRDVDDETEAWIATIVASYGAQAPFACAAEIIAALKGDGAA